VQQEPQYYRDLHVIVTRFQKFEEPLFVTNIGIF